MFNKETKQGRRSIIAVTIIAYWLLFWIFPSVFLNIVGETFRLLGSIFNFFLRIDLEGFVYYYLIIAPLLSILPYKILKRILGNFNYSFIFFLSTIVVPYIYMFFYIKYILISMFAGANFPF